MYQFVSKYAVLLSLLIVVGVTAPAQFGGACSQDGSKTYSGC